MKARHAEAHTTRQLMLAVTFIASVSYYFAWHMMLLWDTSTNNCDREFERPLQDGQPLEANS